MAIDYFDKGRSWEEALPLIHTLKDSIVLPRHELKEMANLLVRVLFLVLLASCLNLLLNTFITTIIEERSIILRKYCGNRKVLS